jgi:hypothetical protein
MKLIATTILATFLMLGTAFAQNAVADTNFDGCTSIEETKAYLLDGSAPITIVNETDKAIEFSHANLPTNLIVLFDGNGCVAGSLEVPKKK